MLAAIDEHKQRLEVANHIEGVMPDIVAKGLLQKIGVFYRAQKYGEGLLGFVSDLQVRLASNKDELRALANGQKIKKAEQKDKGTLAFIGIMLAVVLSGILCGLYVWLRKRQHRKKEAEAATERERIEQLQQELQKAVVKSVDSHRSKARTERQPSYTRSNEYPAVVVIPDSGIDYTRRNDDDSYNSGSSGGSSGSSSSSSSDSGSSGSSDYGSWGGGGSDSGSSSYDSGSSSSGFDGGGSSDSW